MFVNSDKMLNFARANIVQEMNIRINSSSKIV